jgi:hypothetical protein
MNLSQQPKRWFEHRPNKQNDDDRPPYPGASQTHSAGPWISAAMREAMAAWLSSLDPRCPSVIDQLSHPP